MGISNMTIKDFSSKLDKVFLAFKEAKDNKKDNKFYKEQLEELQKICSKMHMVLFLCMM